MLGLRSFFRQAKIILGFSPYPIARAMRSMKKENPFPRINSISSAMVFSRPCCIILSSIQHWPHGEKKTAIGVEPLQSTEDSQKHFHIIGSSTALFRKLLLWVLAWDMPCLVDGRWWNSCIVIFWVELAMRFSIRLLSGSRCQQVC